MAGLPAVFALGDEGGHVLRTLSAAAALGLAIASASASVPLPLIEQASGVSSLAPVLKQTTPAVVSVAIRERASKARNTSLSKSPRGQRAGAVVAEQPMLPSGSGVLVDSGEGLILTNAHVIDGAEDITVAFADGRELPARRIGADAASDIAVLKVPTQLVPAIPMADSDRLEVGDFVLAIGNPFQIGQTVTSGIVSGLHRNHVGIGQYEDFIQTDAAIYPGNSGGPLINLRGELIGINTAFVSAGNTHAGMGFAIPINMARAIAAQIVEYGEGSRPQNAVAF
jgi:S1-C subfamily serine protease